MQNICHRKIWTFQKIKSAENQRLIIHGLEAAPIQFFSIDLNDQIITLHEKDDSALHL
jgi:hypothetical protein